MECLSGILDNQQSEIENTAYSIHRSIVPVQRKALLLLEYPGEVQINKEEAEMSWIGSGLSLISIRVFSKPFAGF